MADDKIAQVFRHGRINFDTDHRTEAALFNKRLEFADQIFGFFFHFNVGIAQDTEQATRDDIETGEKLVQEQ